MPRLLLKSGRNLTASVPWAAPRGRFTLSFEAHVIALLQHCRTVPGAGPDGRDHGGPGRWGDAPRRGARDDTPGTGARPTGSFAIAPRLWQRAVFDQLFAKVRERETSPARPKSTKSMTK